MDTSRIVRCFALAAVLALPVIGMTYGDSDCNDCAQAPNPPPNDPEGDPIMQHRCTDVIEPLESVEGCTHGQEPGMCNFHTACEPDGLAFNPMTDALESHDCEGGLVERIPVPSSTGHALVASGEVFELITRGATLREQHAGVGSITFAD